MKKKLSIIPAILCLMFSQLHAQVFTHYKSALDYSFVTDIAFDNKGNTWYATYSSGVLRYDGTEWTRYSKEQGLSSDYPHALACDAVGNIWVVTSAGYSVFNGSEWKNYDSGNGGIGTEENRINTIETDTLGNVWLGTKGGPYRYDGSWWSVPFDFGFLGFNIEAIAPETDSTFWIGGEWGICYFDGSWRTDYTERLTHKHVNTIKIDGDGDVWIGTKGGVSMYDGVTWTSYTMDDGLGSNSIEDIAVDTKGNIWCASTGGVSEFDGKAWTYHKIHGEFLPWVYIQCIVASADGSVHVGSFNGNLSNKLLRYDGTGWTWNTPGDCVAGFVRAMTEDKLGNKWFGTSEGLSKWDKGEWKTYTEEDGLAHKSVLAVAVDDSGFVWCGTPGGISGFDGAEWTTYTTMDGLPGNRVHTIGLDAGGQLWAGTDSGAARLDLTGWIAYKDSDGLAGNRVRAIETGPDGVLWFGTDAGISGFDGTEWKSYSVAEGLADPEVFTIAVDTSGLVWCGTGSGISAFDGTKWSSLGSSKIRSMAFDSGNMLWMDSEGIISRYDGTKFINYGRNDGLKLISGPILIDSGDTLWIGSDPPILDVFYIYSGFSRMNPRTDFTAPVGRLWWDLGSDVRCGDSLVISVFFDEPMLNSSPISLILEGAVERTVIPLIREDNTTYETVFIVPNTEGEVNISFTGGMDLWGNELASIPAYGERFIIHPVTVGDVDNDGLITAFDASLTYWRTLDDRFLCFNPAMFMEWRNWRDTAANADGIEGITLADVRMILDRSTEFPVYPFTTEYDSIWPGTVRVVIEDGYLVFYPTGYLTGLNIEVPDGGKFLGIPEYSMEGLLTSQVIEEEAYRFGGCLCCPLIGQENTPLLKIPITGNGSITLNMIANGVFLTKNLEFTGVSVHPSPLESVVLYPNPADDLLMIQGLKEPGILRIYSVSGILMKTASLQSGHEEIDVSGLPEGIYLLNIETDEGIIVKRMSVQ